MKKTCLNCKWEPKWSELLDRAYFKRRYGNCRFPLEEIILPKVYTLTKQNIVRYDDDSGVMENCRTWEAKDG